MSKEDYNRERLLNIISISFGLLLTAVFPVSLPRFVRAGAIYYILWCVVAAAIIFFVRWSADRILYHGILSASSKKIKTLPAFRVYFLPCILVWSLYLAAFYPGIMTIDSMTQWSQITTLDLNDYHPVMHTLLNWTLTRLWHSPASIVLFQIVFMAAVVAFGMLMLEKNGVPRKILIGISLFYAFFPLNGAYAVTLWKDIPYSAAMLLLTLWLIVIVRSGGEWLVPVKHKLFMGVLAAAICLVRHNGIAPVLLVFAGLLILFSRQWKHILPTLAVCIVLVLLVKIPFYDYMGVVRKTGGLTGLKIHQIAAVVISGKPLTPEESAVVQNILPVEDWKKFYTPYTGDYLFTAPRFNGTVFWKPPLPQETSDTWQGLAARYPFIILKHMIKNSSIVWRIRQFPDGYTMSVWVEDIAPNEFGIQTKPLLPRLNRFFKGIFHKLAGSDLCKCFFGRSALYLYAAIFSVILCAVKPGGQGIKWLLVLLPLLGNTFTLMIFSPAQDTRYLYSAILIAPALTALCFLPSALYPEKQMDNFSEDIPL